MEKNYDDKAIDLKLRKLKRAYVIVMSMLIAAIYVVFTIISWDFNVGNWHPITRGICILLFIVGWIFISLGYSGAKKEANEPRAIHEALQGALNNASEHLKDLEKKNSIKKSDFQQRLENLAKERGIDFNKLKE